jgi:hypothetical protein
MLRWKRLRILENEIGKRGKKSWLLHLEMVSLKPRIHMWILFHRIIRFDFAGEGPTPWKHKLVHQNVK